MAKAKKPAKSKKVSRKPVGFLWFKKNQDKSRPIALPVSLGEWTDRSTILVCKKNDPKDPDPEQTAADIESLNKAYDGAYRHNRAFRRVIINCKGQIDILAGKLQAANKEQYDVMARLRVLTTNGTYGDEFNSLSSANVQLDSLREDLKHQINALVISCDS